MVCVTHKLQYPLTPQYRRRINLASENNRRADAQAKPFHTIFLDYNDHLTSTFFYTTLLQLWTTNNLTLLSIIMPIKNGMPSFSFPKKTTDFISVLNFNLITAGFQWNMIPEIYVRQKVLKNYVMCENMGWLWCSVLRFANTMVFLFSRQPCLISSILIHGTFWILSYTQSQFCTLVKVDPPAKMDVQAVGNSLMPLPDLLCWLGRTLLITHIRANFDP